MVSQLPSLNRRQWLKSTVAGVAGLAVARQLITAPARAQHEVDRSAKRSEPVRISGNENPFGPSQAAQAAMLQAMEKSCRYPFAESQELIKLIAAKEGCSTDNVVLGVASSATPVTSANGHAGVTISLGLSVTLISDSRVLFSKNAAGTRLDAGTVTGLRSKNAASEYRSRCFVLWYGES